MNKRFYLLAICLLLITGCEEEKPSISQKPNIDGNENVITENGNKVNISEKLKEDKYYENYKITESTLVTNDGMTTFKCKITNILSTENKGGLVDVVFVNKDNEEISKLTTYIPSLQPGGETYIEATIVKDMVNAYDYYIKMK